MRKNNIYLILQGRIGNQLFQYAFARHIQNSNPNIKNIVIDDSRVLKLGWKNSLEDYNLPNVEYVHKNIIGIRSVFSIQFWLRLIYKLRIRNKDFNQKFKVEKKMNKKLNKHGMFICENGYLDYTLNYKKPIYLEGYFQSEKYFSGSQDDILNLLNSQKFSIEQFYPNLDLFEKRNVVCISAKIEHNVGSSLYDVCSIDYWKIALDYVVKNVEKPVFFICSDNVDYFLSNLIDVQKFEYVIQNKSAPMGTTLQLMSKCKHFIIGNTTYAWWAQYLCQNKNKIVLAPSRWMKVEMPIDIYQEGWIKIKV